MTRGKPGDRYYTRGLIIWGSGDGTTFNLVESFSDATGENPQDAPIQAGTGDLYGTASQDGANGDGTVFQDALTLPDVVQFHMAINSVNENAGMASVRVDRASATMAAPARSPWLTRRPMARARAGPWRARTTRRPAAR